MGKGDPSPPRAGLVVGGVVLLLALGALGLAWGRRVELPAEAYRPNLTLVVALLVGTLGVLAMVFWILGLPPRATWTPPKRRHAWARVLAMAVLLGLLLLFFQLPRGTVENPLPEPTVTPPPDGPPKPAPEPTGGTDPLLAGLFALALVLVMALCWWLLRRRRSAPPPLTEAERVRQVIAAGRSALAESDDRRAGVIAAYVAMESALARVGLARGRADTPSDMLTRADQAGLFGPTARAAAAELTELFELARFSERELPADASESAGSALARIDAELAAVADAAAAGGSGGQR